MNWLDILLLILLGFGLIEGFKTGLVMQLTGILALVLGLLCVKSVAPHISPYISSVTNITTTTLTILSYVVSFAVIVIVVFIVGFLINLIFKLPILNSLNKLLGAFFSVLKWGILFSIILFVVAKLDRNDKILTKTMRNDSIMFSYLVEIPQSLVESKKTLK